MFFDDDSVNAAAGEIRPESVIFAILAVFIGFGLLIWLSA